MTEKTQKVIATDVNSSFEDISLWKLKSHKSALEILQRTSLQFLNDRSEGLAPRLPSIIISADSRGLGAETLARAFSSSIGNKFKIGLAETLGYENMVQSFFLDEPEDTTFYIPSAENLIHLAQQKIYTILKEQILTYTTFDRKKVKVPFNNRLIILGTTNEQFLISSLLHAIDIRVSLVSYSYELLMSILKQRVEFWLIRIMRRCWCEHCRFSI